MSRRHRATVCREFAGQEYAVSGTVIFGTTSAMGPNPTEVTDYTVEDKDGNEIDFLAWIRDQPDGTEDDIASELWTEAKRNWREQ